MPVLMITLIIYIIISCECYWTRSIPIHRYIQKGVGIWELGRTYDTGTNGIIVLTKWRVCPWLQHFGLNYTLFSAFV